MPFQILALSGGGYRGLFTSTVLARLEQQAQRPIGDCFDLIAGTSIGGVIALGLDLGKSAESSKKMFLEHGEEIFTRGEPPRGRVAKLRARWAQWRQSKYDGTVLREKIEAVVGKDTKLGDARTRLLIPSVNMTKGSVQMFKTAHHQNFLNDHKLSAVDVAMATSAFSASAPRRASSRCRAPWAVTSDRSFGSRTEGWFPPSCPRDNSLSTSC